MQLGRLLVIIGALLLGLGVILMLGARFTFLGLGKLPGDIVYKSKNVAFYFPIVTCLLISALLTLVIWLVSFLGRR